MRPKPQLRHRRWSALQSVASPVGAGGEHPQRTAPTASAGARGPQSRHASSQGGTPHPNLSPPALAPTQHPSHPEGNFCGEQPEEPRTPWGLHGAGESPGEPGQPDSPAARSALAAIAPTTAVGGRQRREEMSRDAGGRGEGVPRGTRKTNPNPRDIHRATPAKERAEPRTCQREDPGQIQEDSSAALLPRPPPNSPQNQTSLRGARLRCVRAHVFSSQSLNEVFAENLQFPHGLNLAKIAFLTLLGFNSNKPPLYYGTRSHCLDTARKSFIRKENEEGKREMKKGGGGGGGRKERQTNKSCSLHPGDFLNQANSRRASSGAAGERCLPAAPLAPPNTQNYFWCGFTSHAPSHPPLLKNAERSRRGSLTKL